MRRANLTVKVRDQWGKGVARKLRQGGRIPAVLYGDTSDPQALSIDRHEIVTVIEGEGKENTILSLTIEGQEKQGEVLALTKATQHNPITDELIHVDLMRISLDRVIHTSVPIHLTGTAAGVKKGGVLEHQLRHLEIRCLPLEIPEAVEVSVEDLEIGQTIHVSDLPVPANVTVLNDERTAVAVVESPAKLIAAEEAAAEEAKAEVEGEEAEVEGEEAEAKKKEEGEAEEKSSE
jgi:large subunit ribosomal protein L25